MIDVIMRRGSDCILTGERGMKLVLYSYLNPNVDFDNVVGQEINIGGTPSKVLSKDPVVGFALGTAWELNLYVPTYMDMLSEAFSKQEVSQEMRG